MKDLQQIAFICSSIYYSIKKVSKKANKVGKRLGS